MIRTVQVLRFEAVTARAGNGIAHKGEAVVNGTFVPDLDPNQVPNFARQRAFISA